MSEQMVSMKLPKPKKGKGGIETVPMGAGDEYPWGLRLQLQHEQLKALGMGTLPKVGATFALEARVKVIGVSENTGLSGAPSRTVELQVTDCCLEDDDEIPAPRMVKGRRA